MDPTMHSALITTDDELVTELELNKDNDTPYALIVEGPEDANLLRFVINTDVNIIY